MRPVLAALVTLLVATPASALDTVLVRGTTVSPINPRTLEPSSRTLTLPGHRFEASPDGRTLATFADGELRFIDVATWKLTDQRVTVPGALGIYWTEKDRLLVTTANGQEQAAVYVVDPDRPQPLARRALDHTAMDGQKVGDYYAVLDSDQRFDGPRRLDDAVVRIFSAGGRQLHVVKLGYPTGDDEVRALTAFGGQLYVGAGRHFFRIDPRTGKRTSFRSPGEDYIYGWLTATKRRLVAYGLRGNAIAALVFDRQSLALLRSVASPSEQRGFGSGWVTYAFPRSGLTGYDANGTRLWRTLRGVGFNAVDHVRRYLYVRALQDGESVLTRAIDKRTGRITGRRRAPVGDTVVAADSDGEIVNYVGDHGDESDT